MFDKYIADMRRQQLAIEQELAERGIDPFAVEWTMEVERDLRTGDVTIRSRPKIRADRLL
jgi:hypothetical protein